jgi:hypothetical protein
MALTKRLVKGSPLTFQEGDDNLDYLENLATNTGSFVTTSSFNAYTSSLSSSLVPSLTSGSVLFSNGTTIAQDNANFFWDDINDRLGIGTNTPDSKLTIRADGLGSTIDISAGLLLVNKTAAALGAPQYSPFATFEGRAWNTVSGNTRLRYRMGIIPAQSNPTSGTFVIQSGIDEAAFSTVASINQGGTLTLSNALSVAGISTFSQDVTVNANTSTFRLNATNEITNTTAMTVNNTSKNIFIYNGSINTTGGTQTIRGFYYNPTVTNTTGTTNIGFQNTSGNNLFNSTSGNTLIGTTTDAGYKLDITGTTRVSGNATLGGISLTGEFFGPSITYFNGPIINTGTFNLRYATVNLPTTNASFINAEGLTINGGFNTVSTISGSGVLSFRLANTANLKTWYIENSRHGATGSLELSTDIGTTKALIIHPTTYAVGINTNTDANSSAQLEIASTNKGFLPPRMATTNSISTPATGLQIYNTTTNANQYYDGTNWQSVAVNVLTSYTASAGTVVSGDTIKEAIQKVDGNVAVVQTQISSVQVGNNLFNYYNFR